MKSFHLACVLVLTFLLLFPLESEAKRKKRRYPVGPHPVVLWGQTLGESSDAEQRKVAAFKLSQYTRPIFQPQVIDTLLRCMKDPDIHIRVLCTKALSRAESHSRFEEITKALLGHYDTDPSLRSTIVRTLMIREENSPQTHDRLLAIAKKTKDPKELTVLMGFFEKYGSGSKDFVDVLVKIYKEQSDLGLRTSIVKALGDQGQGQEEVVALLSECMDTKDTPLQLNCLSGLEKQAKGDPRAWTAVEKTIRSSDPDVLIATLDVINAFPSKPNASLTKQLVELIQEIDESDLRERAILAVGVCGDKNAELVQLLQALVAEKSEEEGIRIAAALVLGKQAGVETDAPKKTLQECYQTETSKPLRTACELGLKDLDQGTVKQDPSKSSDRATVRRDSKKKS